MRLAWPLQSCLHLAGITTRPPLSGLWLNIFFLNIVIYTKLSQGGWWVDAAFLVCLVQKKVSHNTFSKFRLSNYLPHRLAFITRNQPRLSSSYFTKYKPNVSLALTKDTQVTMHNQSCQSCYQRTLYFLRWQQNFCSVMP